MVPTQLTTKFKVTFTKEKPNTEKYLNKILHDGHIFEMLTVE